MFKEAGSCGGDTGVVNSVIKKRALSMRRISYDHLNQSAVPLCVYVCP
jgi:hypothetical protein